MKYDIIIIGAGSAGLNIAGFMNKAGFKVLLIDKSDENIGGDCLNFGCIPSKALIHISKLVHSAKESEEFGLKINGKVNIKAVMDYIKDKKEISCEDDIPNKEEFEIIGRPITLSDVLLAFTAVQQVTRGADFLVNIDVIDGKVVDVRLNLTETLDNQSKECLEFLYKILK